MNEKVEIRIPETLSDLKLRQYQKYVKLDENLEENYKNQQIVKIFADIPRPEKIPASVANEIITNVNTSLRQEGKLIQMFKLGDVEFGMIPSLEDMSFGEYIDLNENIAKWENFHKAMAVLFRPITKKSNKVYDIEEYVNTSKYCDYMLEAPMDVVYGSVVFFWTLMNDLKKAFQISLQKEIKKKKFHLPEEVSSIINGDGLLQLIHSLNQIYSDMKPLLHYPSPSVLPSLNTTKNTTNSRQTS